MVWSVIQNDSNIHNSNNIQISLYIHPIRKIWLFSWRPTAENMVPNVDNNKPSTSDVCGATTTTGAACSLKSFPFTGICQNP